MENQNLVETNVTPYHKLIIFSKKKNMADHFLQEQLMELSSLWAGSGWEGLNAEKELDESGVAEGE